ncbi:protein gp37 [Ochrobactrum daejeonense]|uniref:Protein gp37 n=1 Tax=Brucella daejeonensis TaxID=659015 RepID=A0A7W9B0H6_9HYPH|nr:phage Gp37/Gp68 family protein [Brucella daejeonensis]MBB5703564.1 protein gp37 [Brucella daejeonensis]
MADKTHIEWTDATWNPITGCSVVSPGCTNCYAMKLAGTRLQHHPSRVGLTVGSKTGPVWNGKVRRNREWLAQPLEWKKPRMVFVCAHGDLFHEDVPDDWILDVFTVMAIASRHTFQILTKRADRMRDFLSRGDDLLEEIYANWYSFDGGAREVWSWPLPNVWLGVSVEDQKRANERIPALLDTPAAIRWVSAEPLLGPVDLDSIKIPGVINPLDSLRSEAYADIEHGQYAGQRMYCGLKYGCGRGIDWVVAGGESGKGARPMHPDWARSLRDQCAAAGVPFFFKQWGGWQQVYDRDVDDPDWRRCGGTERENPRGRWLNLEGGTGFHGERVIYVNPVSKNAAGRMLDQSYHDAMPANPVGGCALAVNGGGHADK